MKELRVNRNSIHKNQEMTIMRNHTTKKMGERIINTRRMLSMRLLAIVRLIKKRSLKRQARPSHNHKKKSRSTTKMMTKRGKILSIIL